MSISAIQASAMAYRLKAIRAELNELDERRRLIRDPQEYDRIVCRMHALDNEYNYRSDAYNELLDDLYLAFDKPLDWT